VIFIDSNVPMYLVGRDHPNKTRARLATVHAATDGERMVTDAEVFQEILHRYRAIDRSDMIQSAFDVLLGIVDEVHAITLADVERAKSTVLQRRRLSARDALHLAVMARSDITRILSYDQGFDGVPDIERLT
jgi:predicted nucleic acid-binding protein